MGLLDQITSDLKSALSGASGQSSLVDGVKDLLTNSSTNGLEGLVQRFKEKGLGDTIASWISTGENKAVTNEQIQKVLGSGFIQQLAQKAGISQEKVSQQLAVMLPQIIDKLTPNGKLPESGTLQKG
jgi:uncharacterized protein YidB (DUF937 family)